MRISVVGLPASGKSTLAQMISEKLSIPHIHLDRFWFEAGGVNVNRATSDEDREKVRTYIRAKTAEAIKSNTWVSDGFYSRTVGPELAQRADVILFLDIPLWRRLFNHAQRILTPAERHKELNFWHELTFFYEIVRRTYANGPRLRQFIEEYKNKVVVLKSRKEIKNYLNTLK